jgi:hypothetical protein
MIVLFSSCLFFYKLKRAIWFYSEAKVPHFRIHTELNRSFRQFSSVQYFQWISFRFYNSFYVVDLYFALCFFFAAHTAIARVGIKGMNTDLAIALHTLIILVIAWAKTTLYFVVS